MQKGSPLCCLQPRSQSTPCCAQTARSNKAMAERRSCGADAASSPLPLAPPSKGPGVVWQQMSSDALREGWGWLPGAASAGGRQSRIRAAARDAMAPWQAPTLDLQERSICTSLLHSAVPGLRVLISSSWGSQPRPALRVPASLSSPGVSLPARLPGPWLCWLSSFSFDKFHSALECRMAAGLPPA